MIRYDIFINCSWVATRWHSSVHIYTQKTHRTTQNKKYLEQHKNLGRVRAVPHLCGFYPGICLTTEQKARVNLSQGSRIVPAFYEAKDRRTEVTCTVHGEK
jgi:hypothetical protein